MSDAGLAAVRRGLALAGRVERTSRPSVLVRAEPPARVGAEDQDVLRRPPGAGCRRARRRPRRRASPFWICAEIAKATKLSRIQPTIPMPTQRSQRRFSPRRARRSRHRRARRGLSPPPGERSSAVTREVGLRTRPIAAGATCRPCSRGARRCPGSLVARPVGPRIHWYQYWLHGRRTFNLPAELRVGDARSASIWAARRCSSASSTRRRSVHHRGQEPSRGADHGGGPRRPRGARSEARTPRPGSPPSGSGSPARSTARAASRSTPSTCRSSTSRSAT